MPKGISEIDVHQAADALVTQGERPTVERIRAHLGTGSPNTVTRWLETWWGSLASRLSGDRVLRGLPELPTAVPSLFEQARGLAVEKGLEQQLAAVSKERDELESEREALQLGRAEVAGMVATARRRIDNAQKAQLVASAQVAELQRQVEHHTQHAADLAAQRDMQEKRTQALESDLREARNDFSENAKAFEQERRLQAERINWLKMPTKGRAAKGCRRKEVLGKRAQTMLAKD